MSAWRCEAAGWAVGDGGVEFACGLQTLRKGRI